MNVLNLYCGIGGNRKLWDDVEVTAVEMNPEIAAVYQENYPNDFVIIGDAHETLRKHFMEFDMIWSSIPCQSHTKMMKFSRHQLSRYPDLKLYEEILFLQHFCPPEIKWVVENVVPYYSPLVQPTKQVGRHLFWSNFPIHADDYPTPQGVDFINTSSVAGLRQLQDWLGIHWNNPVYYEGSHCPCQIARNAVHPEIGLQVFNSALGHRPGLENLPLFGDV